MPRHYAANPYCTRCRLRVPVCICGEVPRMAIATKLIVVAHAIEWGRASNTGHLARLAFAGAEVRVHGRRRRPLDLSDVDAASCLVLFPGTESDPLTPALAAELTRPTTLLVPDGNWNQANAMMHRLEALKHARRVAVAGEDAGITGLRRNVVGSRRSTFEAIARALDDLEGGGVEKRAMEFFVEYLRRKGGH